MTRRYSKSVEQRKGAVFQVWFNVINERNADFQTLAADQRIIELVRSRIKKSIGRVADMPIKCGGHLTGFSVSLTLENGHVKLSYWISPELIGESPPPVGIAHVDDAGPPLRLVCPVCGVLTERNDVWVLQAALTALAGAARTRPVIQIRT